MLQRHPSVRQRPADPPPTAATPIGVGIDPSRYGHYAAFLAADIQTAAPDLDWLNKGVFIAVAARAAAGVIYDTYLVE